MDPFTAAFHESIDEKQLRELYKIVSDIGCEEIFLMGGMVYRNIIQTMYGKKCPDVDFDFIVDTLPEPLQIPGWTVTKNRFGSPKLSRDGTFVDISPLRTMPSIVRKGWQPTIENHLLGSPLKLQSMVYSFTQDLVIGEIGKQAILDRTVSVHDKSEAENAAMKKGLSLHDFIKQKAQSVGFTPSYD